MLIKKQTVTVHENIDDKVFQVRSSIQYLTVSAVIGTKGGNIYAKLGRIVKLKSISQNSRSIFPVPKNQ